MSFNTLVHKERLQGLVILKVQWNSFHIKHICIKVISKTSKIGTGSIGIINNSANCCVSSQ